MADVALVFSTAAAVVFLGFFGALASRRTSIPDVLLLIALGLLLGPILEALPREALVDAVPYLAAFAIAVMLFDSGLSMDLYKVLKQSKRALPFAVTSFALSLAFVALGAHYLMGLPWIHSLVLGGMIAGSSSVVVMVFLRRVEVSEETSLLLALESIITDVLCIIAVIVLLEYMRLGCVEIEKYLSFIASKFSTGIVLGVLSGLIWLNTLNVFGREENTYMLTLAFLLAVYALTETLGGCGAIAALMFGLTLGNHREVASIFQMSIDGDFLEEVIQGTLRYMHSEITFLVRSFFFVLLGLIYILPPDTLSILYGFALTLALLAARYLAVEIIAARAFSLAEKEIMTFAFGRGLAAAVLSTMLLDPRFAVSFGSEYAMPIMGAVLNVIVLSNLVMFIAVAALSRTIKAKSLW